MDYGMFAAKFLTVAVVIATILVTLVMLIIGRSDGQTEDQIEVKNLNDKYKSMTLTLKNAMLPAKQYKQEIKREKHNRKDRDRGKNQDTEKSRLFVCRFDGDVRASAVSSLQEEVTAILSVATKSDEIVAIITSPGGVIHGYGLAASQLKRIRDRQIPLTAVVDKVAASGGYMMACVANKIIAAPFAIVGSIGVVAQMPNFSKFLKKHDIDYEEITAGEYKRTLTMFGENTDADRNKFREELEDAHELFKEFVAAHRPQVDIAAIATGEYWYGKRALERQLIDELSTSDDYLFRRAQDADVFEVTYVRKRSKLEKLIGSATQLFRSL
ncbi:MAG: protease SohB [Proteobacteria bacterium]|nr:protease SohB [Pseudomonadota bacterium]